MVRNRAKPHGSGCPYCANRAVDETNSLATKCPEIAEEWHPYKNGDLLPKDVNYKSYKKVWWVGKCGHEWQTMIRIRTRKLSAGCPNCRESKGEIKVEKVLRELGIEFETQVRFADCKDKRSLPFDFKVGNLLIEYQGQHHFQPVNYGQEDYLKWFGDVQRRDQIKRDWCRQNGYQLLEIPYTKFDSVSEIIEREVFHGS